MHFFNFDQPLNVMRFKWPALCLSAVLVLGSLLSLGIKGMNWGLDFTGGTVVEVGLEQSADLNTMRQVLAQAGFADAVIQLFGSSKDVLIRIPLRTDVAQEVVGERVLQALNSQQAQPVTLRRVEFVGPSVGDELKQEGGLGLLVALLAIMLYVAMRFEWRLSVGAVLALAHDVILTFGLFSVLQLEFDLTVLAAILALIGYSINDTIVVFDRLRESFRLLRDVSVADTINHAISSTLNRTFITSFTTVLVLLVLFFKGGALIHGFATALLFGIVVGTYSSVYVASALAQTLGLCRQDMIPQPIAEEEGG